MSTALPKIAHVVCTYPPYRGGMGQVAFEYTERLRARGYNVHVFTSREDVVDADPSYVHRVPSVVSIGNASVMPSLFQRLKGFDLVHLHYPFFGGAEPVIVRKALRHDQGLVMTYHMDAVASGARGMFFEAHKQLLLPWLVRRCDRVLVSSQDYADHCSLAQIPSVQDRIEIHPFGVDLQRFSVGNDVALRTELGVHSQIPVLLFVGGLDRAHYFKGLPVLLEALSEVKESFHLVVVGDGDMRASFEHIVQTYNISSSVTFAGSVSHENLPRYYRMADVHLFPSTRRAEAFGLVAVEAAASGIPTIASRLPGVRSVVLDGETGLLVTPESISELRDAIRLLLTHADLRERFGRSARLHAEAHFAWDPIITHLEQTYTSVLQQQTSREYQGD